MTMTAKVSNTCSAYHVIFSIVTILIGLAIPVVSSFASGGNAKTLYPSYAFRAKVTRTHSATNAFNTPLLLPYNRVSPSRLCVSPQSDNDNANDAAESWQVSAPTTSTQTPLCDLQTFIKLCGFVQTGGEAKHAIQGGECYLNGEIETRRAKKLFSGDEVSFGKEGTMDVSDEIKNRGYVYKKKQKKVKPAARVVDANGTLEFGGRYRSEEWRAERKQKKAERKSNNKEE